MAVSDGRQIVVFKDLGLVSPGLRRADALVPARPPRRRSHALPHHRLSPPGRTPSRRFAPPRRAPRSGAGAQRQPRQHRRAGAPPRRGPGGERQRPPERARRREPALVGPRGRHHRLRRRDGACSPTPRPDLGGRGGRDSAAPTPTSVGAFSLDVPATRPRSTPPGTAAGGLRPLVLGRPRPRLGRSPPRRPPWTSSGRPFVREVEPGELIAIDAEGLRSSRVPRSPTRTPTHLP